MNKPCRFHNELRSNSKYDWEEEDYFLDVYKVHRMEVEEKDPTAFLKEREKEIIEKIPPQHKYQINLLIEFINIDGVKKLQIYHLNKK